MERFKIIAKSKINELPKTTGVYLFCEKSQSPNPKSQKAIYIGKAVNIQSRVKNHFNPARNASHSDAGGAAFKDNILSEKTTHIGFYETGSEIEALVLEANLIKKYQPKYNVVWRDDKNYFYVAIANPPAGGKNKVPHVFITHQPRLSSLRGVATTKQSQTRIPRQPLRLLRSARNDEFVGPFVEGTALKKTLRFLRRVFPYYTSAKHPKNKCTYCHLDLCPGPNPDLANYKKNIEKLVLILKGKKGAVLSSLKKEMKRASKENKFEKAGKLRDQIYALQQVMAHTHIINDTRNDAIHLSSNLTIVNFNDNRAWPKTEKILQKILWPSLRGEQSLNRIECYDVSNIQGKLATGSMVVFVDGKPDKNQYRKFRIRFKNEPNDIAMLKEVLERRFKHAEWKYPEVILIDGGKAQLNIAIQTKKERLHQKMRSHNSMRIEKTKNILVMAIAKGRQELFIENKKEPIPLKSLPREVYNLVKNLDDEAHRFAITYHKTLRKKELLG